MGSCGANIREFDDQSEIKGNLSQINIFFMAKHGLNFKMRIRPTWSLIFGGRKKVKKKRGEEKKKRKKRRKVWKL